MINHSFPPERRAQALGYWSLVGAGAPVIGVVIGGPLVDSFG
jgi:MFS family permease